MDSKKGTQSSIQFSNPITENKIKIKVKSEISEEIVHNKKEMWRPPYLTENRSKNETFYE